MQRRDEVSVVPEFAIIAPGKRVLFPSAPSISCLIYHLSRSKTVRNLYVRLIFRIEVYISTCTSYKQPSTMLNDPLHRPNLSSSPLKVPGYPTRTRPFPLRFPLVAAVAGFARCVAGFDCFFSAPAFLLVAVALVPLWAAPFCPLCRGPAAA